MKTSIIAVVAAVAFTVSAQPSNDACENANNLVCNGPSVSATTTGSTFDGVGFCGTSNTAVGVWYTFTGTGGPATLSTCNSASYDTKISVFTGDCNSLTCVGGQDDAAGCSGFTTEFTFLTTAGVQYRVLVHGFGSASGAFTLSLTCAGPSTGHDACPNAIDIECGDAVDGDTRNAVNDGVGFCGTSNTAPDVWYKFVGTGDDVTFSTCNNADFDTKISVFSGTGCDALTCVAGQDDNFAAGCSGFTTRLENIQTQAGLHYFVLVHGFGSASGQFTLSTECASVAPTASPTMSPTMSPTASPTTPCSTLAQTFTIVEDPSACNPAPTPPTSGSSPGSSGNMNGRWASMGCNRNAYANRDIGEAITASWGGNPIFSSVPLDDILGSDSVETTWDAANSQWVHTITFEYKPESPVDHVVFSSAGEALEGTTPTISYCGCSPTVTVTGHTSGYNAPDEPSSSSSVSSSSGSSSRCSGAYRPPRDRKIREVAATAPNVAAATTTSSSTLFVALVAGVTAIAVIATVAIVVRRGRQNHPTAVAEVVTVDSAELTADAGVVEHNPLLEM